MGVRYMGVRSREVSALERCPLYGVSAIWGVHYREVSAIRVSAIEICPLYGVSAKERCSLYGCPLY